MALQGKKGSSTACQRASRKALQQKRKKLAPSKKWQDAASRKSGNIISSTADLETLEDMTESLSLDCDCITASTVVSDPSVASDSESPQSESRATTGVFDELLSEYPGDL